MVSEADRRRLLDIARAAIVAHVCGTVRPDLEAADFEQRRHGAFVTLYSGGELRGCIGHLEPDDGLPQIVARCAVAACSADPRFRAVDRAEVDRLSIEVSILGPLEPIRGADDIEIGRHGLVIEKDRRRGLLLPQVATEWGWTREQFLAQTCRKAGLDPQAWMHGATLWRFEAEVFGDLTDG
jgi:AmmeMemoRadiSam system protein A